MKTERATNKMNTPKKNSVTSKNSVSKGSVYAPLGGKNQ